MVMLTLLCPPARKHSWASAPSRPNWSFATLVSDSMWTIAALDRHSHIYAYWSTLKQEHVSCPYATPAETIPNQFQSIHRMSKIELTSSMTKAQSLSSSSWVRGSLKRVTEMVWLSGTGHDIWPTSGFTMSGSHANGIDATRLDLRVQTIDRFVGRLNSWANANEKEMYNQMNSFESERPSRKWKKTTSRYLQNISARNELIIVW